MLANITAFDRKLHSYRKQVAIIGRFVDFYSFMGNLKEAKCSGCIYGRIRIYIYVIGKKV